MADLVHKRLFGDIEIGEEAEQSIQISAEMVDRFIQLSGDISPIHVDEAAAKARGFEGRVVHGLLTSSLVSKILGTILPGPNGLLHDVSFTYKHPVYISDTLHIKVKVTDKHEAFKLVFLKVYVYNQNGAVVCRGKVQSGLSE